MPRPAVRPPDKRNGPELNPGRLPAAPTTTDNLAPGDDEIAELAADSAAGGRRPGGFRRSWMVTVTRSTAAGPRHDRPVFMVR